MSEPSTLDKYKQMLNSILELNKLISDCEITEYDDLRFSLFILSILTTKALIMDMVYFISHKHIIDNSPETYVLHQIVCLDDILHTRISLLRTKMGKYNNGK